MFLQYISFTHIGQLLQHFETISRDCVWFFKFRTLNPRQRQKFHIFKKILVFHPNGFTMNHAIRTNNRSIGKTITKEDIELRIKSKKSLDEDIPSLGSASSSRTNRNKVPLTGLREGRACLCPSATNCNAKNPSAGDWYHGDKSEIEIPETIPDTCPISYNHFIVDQMERRLDHSKYDVIFRNQKKPIKIDARYGE